MMLLQISDENEKFFRIIKSVFLFSRKYVILCQSFNIVTINKQILVSSKFVKNIRTLAHYYIILSIILQKPEELLLFD